MSKAKGVRNRGFVWAGFTSGKLMWEQVDDGWGGYKGHGTVVHPCVYLSRKEARKRFQDVRKVRIILHVED